MEGQEDREVLRQSSLDIQDPIPLTDKARQIHSVLELIHGTAIDENLTKLAAIGGELIEPTPEQPVRYATNRLALTEIDEEARQTFIRPMMEEAGMKIAEHPFGLLGVLPGKNRNLPPIVVMSHTDTVPRGEKYDGSYGVIGGLMAGIAISQAGIKLDRDIIFPSLTGEESSRFRFACFGSESMFLGMNKEQLAAQDRDGKTIAEVVGADRIGEVSQPIFGPRGELYPTPAAVIELHVSQDKRLQLAGLDLAVVDAIAAPQRFDIKIGASEPLEPSEPNHAHSRYFVFTAQGRADHSGATPMTPGARHDGMLATSEFLSDVFQPQIFKDRVAIADIEIEGEAINKVPGISRTRFRISGDTPEEIEEILGILSEKVSSYNGQGDEGEEQGNKYSIDESEEVEGQTFFNPNEIIGRQLTALTFVNAVNAIAGNPRLAAENIVGTVGTFNINSEGVISLGLDIRGTHKESRDEVIDTLRTTFNLLNAFASVDMGKPLVGSGDPVRLDAGLVRQAREVIEKYEIGTADTMFSAAGHDAQNAAKAGIPTVMLFVPSRDGIAHNPDAYTAPEHLEKGVKALAALLIELASE